MSEDLVVDGAMAIRPEPMKMLDEAGERPRVVGRGRGYLQGRATSGKDFVVQDQTRKGGYPGYQQEVTINVTEIQAAFNRIFPRFKSSYFYCWSLVRRRKRPQAMAHIDRFLDNLLAECTKALNEQIAQYDGICGSMPAMNYPSRARAQIEIGSPQIAKMIDLISLADKVAMRIDYGAMRGLISREVAIENVKELRQTLMVWAGRFQRLIKDIEEGTKTAGDDFEAVITRLVDKGKVKILEQEAMVSPESSSAGAAEPRDWLTA